MSATRAALPNIILTSGEPAGIGPDLCLQIAGRDWPCALAVAGDPELLAERARMLGLEVVIEPYAPQAPAIAHQPRTLRVVAAKLAQPCEAGRLNPANASYVLALLERALEGCSSGEFDAMVTAPVQKSVINDAGIAFTGHTEYLASRTGAALPVMMLVAGRLRVALATTHLPLRAVSDALTVAGLTQLIGVLDADLRRRFGFSRPRIVVCGLNPHAGEGGHLGREELDVIAPAIQRARELGADVAGPVPADTAFTPRSLADADVVLAMYHDQGLPALKLAGFGSAVNVTLGLPIIRTSVDHGTALALAGTGQAESGSLVAALEQAITLSTLSSTLSAGSGFWGVSRFKPANPRYPRDPRDPRPGTHPRKRFGQHFLHDPQVIARIVAAIAPRPGERIVEIGPGRGALTAPLLERLGELTAIEIDRQLARDITERFGPALTVITQDVLDVDIAALRGAGAPLRLVGNLPYNISTPLLFRLLEQRAAVRDMHFMLQKEVVDRMVAAPGSKTYGRLTVMLAPWVRTERLLTVGPGAFSPPPKVSSAVVRITPLAVPAFDIGSAGSFDRVVRAAFSQRRKTLRNALKGTVDAGVFTQLGIDPGARAEQLAAEQYAALARASA